MESIAGGTITIGRWDHHVAGGRPMCYIGQGFGGLGFSLCACVCVCVCACVRAVGGDAACVYVR